MDEDELIYEISRLLHRVKESEDVLYKAELYYQEHYYEFSKEFAAYFQDMLERKRDQIEYEYYRIKRMGEAIASGRNYMWEDTLDP